MKRLLYILAILMFCNTLYASPPSRVSTYVSGTTIQAADVTNNEDAIFNYLSAGVDTFKDGSIIGADISGAAAIATSKIDFSDSLTISGALTFTGNNTFAGTTIADIGTITTGIITSINLQGGSLKADTMDGTDLINVSIGTETSTGMIYVNDANDKIDGLGAQGTSGQYLKSAGAGADPTWATLTDTAGTASAGDVLSSTASADTLRNYTGNTSYTATAKSIRVPRDGTYRIKFVCDVTGGGTSNVKIYRNTSAVGTEQDCDGSTFSEDIAGWSAGDLVNFYWKNSVGGGFGVAISNCRVYEATPPDFIVEGD